VDKSGGQHGKALKNMGKYLLGALMPPHCPGCANPHVGQDLCPACRASILPMPEPDSGLDGRDVLAGWQYGGVLADLLTRAKFQSDPAAASALCDFFRGELHSDEVLLPVGAQLVTWIPGPRFRILRRGFDLPRALAQRAGAHLGIPARPLLQLTRRDPPLSAGANRNERQAGVKGRFVLKRRSEEPKTVLLVDDVCTTGATLGEAGEVLFEGGFSPLPFALMRAL
jgi:predicted amidophosphoribosyltransferase